MKLRSSRLLQTGFVTTLLLLTTAVVGLNDPTVLVSIYTDNLGLVTPEGKRLYAEIAKNGATIYTDRTEKGFVDRKRTLSDAELSKLRGC
jgi:muramoyltetrapeptide carboxypeptidase LdcA involved in peptidoglycan recycling